MVLTKSLLELLTKKLRPYWSQLCEIYGKLLNMRSLFIARLAFQTHWGWDAFEISEHGAVIIAWHYSLTSWLDQAGWWFSGHWENSTTNCLRKAAWARTQKYQRRGMHTIRIWLWFLELLRPRARSRYLPDGFGSIRRYHPLCVRPQAFLHGFVKGLSTELVNEQLPFETIVCLA